MAHKKLVPPLTPFSDYVWKREPETPRALCIIGHVPEIIEATSSADREFKTLVLSNACKIEKEFDLFYGISLRVAENCFAQVHTFSEQYRETMDGEEVITSLPIRLMHRLGYIDGLYGKHISEMDHSSKDILDLEAEDKVFEENMNVGVTMRIQELFLPAYELGLHYGRAERFLRENAEELRHAVDVCAYSYLLRVDIPESEIFGEIDHQMDPLTLEYLPATFSPNSEDLEYSTAVYIRGKIYRILAIKARRKILDECKEEGEFLSDGEISVEKLACLVRECSTLLETLKEESAKKWCQTKLSDAIALLGCFNLSHGQVYEIRTGTREIAKILAENGKLSINSTYLELLKELSRPIGNYWAPPANMGKIYMEQQTADALGAFISTIPSPVSLSTVEKLVARMKEELRKDILPGQDPVEDDYLSKTRKIRSMLTASQTQQGEDYWAPSAIVCGRRLASVTNLGVEGAASSQFIIDIENKISFLESEIETMNQMTEDNWWKVFEHALLCEVSSLASDHFLGDQNEKGLDSTLQAELDLLHYGEPRRTEDCLITAAQDRREGYELLEEALSEEDSIKEHHLIWEAAMKQARHRVLVEAVSQKSRNYILPEMEFSVNLLTDHREELMNPEIWDRIIDMLKTVSDNLWKKEQNKPDNSRYSMVVKKELAVAQFSVLLSELSAFDEIIAIQKLKQRLAMLSGGIAGKETLTSKLLKKLKRKG